MARGGYRIRGGHGNRRKLIPLCILWYRMEQMGQPSDGGSSIR